MIYFDYNATTPCDEKVVEAMLPYFTAKFGNAASRTHAYGWTATAAVDKARGAIARLIEASAEEIVFTSGATEACNLAIKGVFELFNQPEVAHKRPHIITCVTEHKAVLDTCAYLERQGARITYLPVDIEGKLSLAALESSITDDTALIALMYANNETGVVHPIAEVGAIAKRHKVWFFCDATQAVGKIPVSVLRDQIDLLAMSAHKFYGPKGVGALFLRRRNPRARVVPQINGGAHEQGFRSGTLNVPGIVGMGRAAEICMQLGTAEWLRQQALIRKLRECLLKISGTVINGSDNNLLPNVCNIAFRGIKAEHLVSRLNGELAFSVGSACTSASQAPSHVLMGMGLDKAVIDGSVRLSIGRYTTEAEIDRAVQLITDAVQELIDEQNSLR
jgi:cysteine desulfurase